VIGLGRQQSLVVDGADRWSLLRATRKRLSPTEPRHSQNTGADPKRLRMSRFKDYELFVMKQIGGTVLVTPGGFAGFVEKLEELEAWQGLRARCELHRLWVGLFGQNAVDAIFLFLAQITPSSCSF
jgi:hypothetical protein